MLDYRVLITSMAGLLLSVFSASYAVAQETEKMQILGLAPEPGLAVLAGTAWFIYLEGKIDPDAANRLEAFIVKNKVPYHSIVILNSPGGSLVGGMELGEVIRKHGFETDIGTNNQKKQSYEYESGGCYSACTLAYVGGVFRYLHEGSHFGVHRFAFSQPLQGEADLAQIASASIVSYLRSMDIDTELFNLSTQAGPSEINEPSIDTLKLLNIVNYGFTKPQWTIESHSGFIYLKGERDTDKGRNKFIVICSAQSQMQLFVMFDSGGHDSELLHFPTHFLVTDERSQPISPVSKEIKDGAITLQYNLSTAQLTSMLQAKTVGLTVRRSYESELFLGFKYLPFRDGAEKLAGLIKSCGIKGL